MDEKTIRQELDELAAATVGNMWLTVALAAALVDAGAVKEKDLLGTLEAFADLVDLETDGEAVVTPLRQAIDLLEGGAGALSNRDIVELTSARVLIEKLRKRSKDGKPSKP